MIFGYKKKYFEIYEQVSLQKKEIEKLQKEIDTLKAINNTLKENIRTITKDKEIFENKNEILQIKFERCKKEKEHLQKLLQKNSFAEFNAKILSNLYLAEVIK